MKLIRIAVAATVMLGVFAASAEAPPAPTAQAFPPANPTTQTAPVAIPPASAHARKVFAMYFTALPLSYDNLPAAQDQYTRYYINPDGQAAYARFGGIMRDRPIPRDPLPGDWRTADAATEIRQAMSAGIDGFTLDLLSLSNHADNDGIYQRLHTMMAVASQVSPSFKMMLMPDVDSYGFSATRMADELSAFTGYSSVYTVDGKVVIAPFSADSLPASYWSDVLAQLKARHGVNAVLLPILCANTPANIQSFINISWGVSEWGVTDPVQVKQRPKWGSRAHAAGKKWMQPIRVQDARPRDSWFDEAANSSTLRASWTDATANKADLALLVTWNDYYETTAFAPSVQHGWALLDINAYYQSKFQTGKKTKITRDAVFISHRIHSYKLKPSWPKYTAGSAMSLRGTRFGFSKGSYQPARNKVEVLTMLTKSAKVKVAIGRHTYTYTAKKGVYVKTFALGTGTVSAKLTRSGKTLGTVSTAESVVSKRAIQDLGYRFASSLRSLPRRS